MVTAATTSIPTTPNPTTSNPTTSTPTTAIPSPPPITSTPTTSANPTVSPTSVPAIGINGVWSDNDLNGFDPPDGWLFIDGDGNVADDIYFWSPQTKVWYHGPYNGRNPSSTRDYLYISRNFYCEYNATVKVTFWTTFCRTESDDIVRLSINDMSQIQTGVDAYANAGIVNDSQVTSYCNGKWYFLGPFTNPSPPRVSINETFEIEFLITITASNEAIALNYITVECVAFTDTPTTSSPTSATPTTTTPDPTTASPTSSTPTTQAPTTASPTNIDPTTAAPTSAQPTTSAPSSTNPTTFEPTTANPSVHPQTSNPTTAYPTTSLPTTSIPTTSVPTTSNPSTFPTTYVPTSRNIVVPDADVGVETTAKEEGAIPDDKTTTTNTKSEEEPNNDEERADLLSTDTLQTNPNFVYMIIGIIISCCICCLIFVFVTRRKRKKREHAKNLKTLAPITNNNILSAQDNNMNNTSMQKSAFVGVGSQSPVSQAPTSPTNLSSIINLNEVSSVQEQFGTNLNNLVGVDEIIMDDIVNDMNSGATPMGPEVANERHIGDGEGPITTNDVATAMFVEQHKGFGLFGLKKRDQPSQQRGTSFKKFESVQSQTQFSHASDYDIEMTDMITPNGGDIDMDETDEDDITDPTGTETPSGHHQSDMEDDPEDFADLITAGGDVDDIENKDIKGEEDENLQIANDIGVTVGNIANDINDDQKHNDKLGNQDGDAIEKLNSDYDVMDDVETIGNFEDNEIGDDEKKNDGMMGEQDQGIVRMASKSYKQSNIDSSYQPQSSLISRNSDYNIMNDDGVTLGNIQNDETDTGTDGNDDESNPNLANDEFIIDGGESEQNYMGRVTVGSEGNLNRNHEAPQ